MPPAQYGTEGRKLGSRRIHHLPTALRGDHFPASSLYFLPPSQLDLSFLQDTTVARDAKEKVVAGVNAIKGEMV